MNAMEFKVDYSSITVFGLPVADALRRVAVSVFGVSVFDEDPEQFFALADTGGRGFAQMYQAPSCTVYAEPRAGGDFVHIELKGEALGRMTFADWQAFVNDLAEDYRIQCSMLHVKWIGGDLSPEMAHQAAEAGNIRVACRRDDGWLRWFRSAKSEEAVPEGEINGGDTCYIGKRKSPRHLCIYNGRGRNDFEFRVKNDRATLLLDELRKAPSIAVASERAMAYVLDFVSFVDMSKTTDQSRAKPLDWWLFFCGEVKRAGVRIKKVIGDFVRGQREQLKRACRVVSLWKRATKPEWVDEQLAAAELQLGEKRLVRARHLQLAWNEAHSLLDEPEIAKPLFPGLVFA